MSDDNKYWLDKDKFIINKMLFSSYIKRTQKRHCGREKRTREIWLKMWKESETIKRKQKTETLIISSFCLV